MIDKDSYFSLKKYLKTLSRPQIEELCENIKFNDKERKLFVSWYNGDTVVKICMDNYICKNSYTNAFKAICSKIYNYLNYYNITFR